VTALALLKRLSLPHLWKAPLRSGLVVLGIALGVAMVIASRATSDALVRTFDDLVQRVAERADVVLIGSESGVPSALAADAAAVPGVAHAAPTLEITTSFVDDGAPLLILGVDFLGDTFFLPFRPADGGSDVVQDPLAFANDPEALLVSQSLAMRRKLAIDSRVQVLGAGGVRTLRVRGILRDDGPAASFGGQVAVMFLDAAQVTFGRGTLVDRIDVALDRHADAEKTLAALRAHMVQGVRVERPEQIGQRLRAYSLPLADGMRLSGLLAMLAAVFIIYNAVSVSVAQRRKEVGVLRALGVLRRDVILHFCIEAGVLALLGTAVGVVLAKQLVVFTHAQTELAISRLYNSTPALPVITLAHVVRGALAGIGVSVIAAFVPARRGARLDPVAALSATSAITGRRSLPCLRMAAVGVLFMLLARPMSAAGTMAAGYAATIGNLGGASLIVPLLIVALRRALLVPVQRLLGMPGRLGLDYVERSLGRSTMNVLSLMVAVALSLGMSGWLGAFEHSVRAWFQQVGAADLVVTAGSPLADRRRMPLASDVLQRLEHLPGVMAVQPMRMVEQHYHDRGLLLAASDTRAYLEQAVRKGKPWKVLQGPSAISISDLYDAPRIVLAENAAFGLNLKAGDKMTLEAPSGPVEFEVFAVVVDYSSTLGAGFIDRRYYMEHWSDSAIDVANLYLEPGAKPAQVADAVRARLGGGNGLFVTETTALREEFVRVADESFSYTHALELIVLLIAVTGVIGTMVASVLDRTREIGMLRAVGATRTHIAGALMIEAVFLGVCAVVSGVIAGTIHSVLLLHTLVLQGSGWNLEFVFPTASAVRISVLVLIASAVAGLLPGLRAARLDVKEALAAE
jgi:putative ABC transport system permease protein